MQLHGAGAKYITLCHQHDSVTMLTNALSCCLHLDCMQLQGVRSEHTKGGSARLIILDHQPHMHLAYSIVIQSA